MEDHSTEIISVAINKRDTDNYSPPKQSANTLFRFFRKFDYLVRTLENGALIPRYYGENVDYLEIGFHQISYPMICFCDITVHRLSEHMNLYGDYGIAFSKSWGISNGIQPLQYINKHSLLRHDFTEAFLSAISSNGEGPAVDFLLSQMLYIKPIEGTMPRDGMDLPKNFTDECEWRYIPKVTPIDLPQIVTEDESASIGVLNKTIENNDCCWLKFDLADIKYIILPSEEDVERLCNIINEIIVGDENLKHRIMTKIILWCDAKEDF